MSAPAAKALVPAPVRITARIDGSRFRSSMTQRAAARPSVCAVQRIQDIRPVDRDGRHGGVTLEEKVVKGHRGLELYPAPSRHAGPEDSATAAAEAPTVSATTSAISTVPGRHEPLVKLVADAVHRAEQRWSARRADSVMRRRHPPAQRACEQHTRVPAVEQRMGILVGPLAGSAGGCRAKSTNAIRQHGGPLGERSTAGISHVDFGRHGPGPQRAVGRRPPPGLRPNSG